MTYTVRRLGESDTEAMRRQFREAFGGEGEPDPPRPMHRPGNRYWGVERNGELVATALDREYTSWFGGVRVPTAGIGGVTVAPEHRGAGVLRPLIEAVLDGARERGALVSGLFATSPGLYRRFGYEVVATLDVVLVPTHALRLGGERTVRRATEADDEELLAVHERWARRRSGPLSHDGPLFSESPTLRVDGVTVAEHDDGTIAGYATWERGTGYGPDERLTVRRLVADDEDTVRSLLSVLGSFSSVTGTTAVTTSGFAPWRHLLRTDHAVVDSSSPYSLAVLDPLVLEALPYADTLRASLPFGVAGRGLRLDVAEGRGTVHADDDPAARSLTAGGLALTVAGAMASSTLRELGHLHGDDTDDRTWDALTCRGPVVVADYF